MPWFWEKKLENCALCIYKLHSPLKCSLRASWRKKFKYFPCGTLLLYVVHETVIAVPPFQKPPLPWKSLLKDLTKFTGQHLYRSLFLNKVALMQVFSCKLDKIFKNSNTCEWLLLIIHSAFQSLHSLVGSLGLLPMFLMLEIWSFQF